MVVVAEEDVEEMTDALVVEVVDAMISQEVIDVLAIEEIEDLVIEILVIEEIDVLQVQETEAIEDQVIESLAIEVLAIEEKDALMILEVIDVHQNLVVLAQKDQDVRADVIKYNVKSLLIEAFLCLLLVNIESNLQLASVKMRFVYYLYNVTNTNAIYTSFIFMSYFS